jgi:O-antigen polysaccharide polymerase Wzy
MQRQINIWAPVSSAVLVCTALFAIWQATVRGNDSTSALATALLFAVSLLFDRYVLRLPFASGSMVYFMLLGLFHLGLVVPWALGIYDISRTPSFLPYGLSRSIALINYSLISFQAGLIFGLHAAKKSVSSARQSSSEAENSEVYFAGCLLLAMGITLFVVGLIGLDPLGYFRLTYSETFRLRAESDPRLFGSGITIAFIGLSIAAAGSSRRRFRIVAIVGATWLLGLMYWGFRGPALIAAIIVYIIARKKGLNTSRWSPLLAGGILLILPVVRSNREAPLDERLSQLSFKDFNILDGPAEMGSSIRPLVETIDLMGAKDFRRGKTYLLGIEGIVPNLALRWEAASKETEDELPPSHWITAMVDPWLYKNYGGMGFSAIAEPYMNFGLPGVILYFIVLALFLVWLEQFAIRSSYALAVWALILGPLLWTTRNDFSNFFRPAVWGLLALVAIRAVSKTQSIVFTKRTPGISKFNPKLERINNA